MEVTQQQTPVRMRVCTHSPRAGWSECRELGHEPAVGIEEPFGIVAAKPLLENLQMVRVPVEAGDRHLVRTKGPLDGLAIDNLRARPSLRRAQHDHWPGQALRESMLARVALNASNVANYRIQRDRHALVHRHRLVALDE